MTNGETVMIEEPRIAQLLFADTDSPGYGYLRLYLGWASWGAGGISSSIRNGLMRPAVGGVLAKRPQNDAEAGDRFRLVSIVH